VSRAPLKTRAPRWVFPQPHPFKTEPPICRFFCGYLTMAQQFKELRASAHRTSPDVSIRPTLVLGQSGDGKLAFDQLQLSLRVLADKMVGGPSAPDAKPFLQFRIPPDFRVSHCLKTYSMKLRRCLFTPGRVHSPNTSSRKRPAKRVVTGLRPVSCAAAASTTRKPLPCPIR
jgi:hypothetical protein